jgi:hypothetical protein
MEADSSMTDQPKTPLQYWQIQLPCDRFPKSKFQFNDRVAIYGKMIKAIATVKLD